MHESQLPGNWTIVRHLARCSKLSCNRTAGCVPRCQITLPRVTRKAQNFTATISVNLQHTFNTLKVKVQGRFSFFVNLQRLQQADTSYRTSEECSLSSRCRVINPLLARKKQSAEPSRSHNLRSKHPPYHEILLVSTHRQTTRLANAESCKPMPRCDHVHMPLHQ